MTSSKNKGIINKDIQTPSGMLYKGTKVRIEESLGDKIRVTDFAGRLFWIKHSDISQ